MKDQFVRELKQILSEDKVRLKERMESHTSLHIGGEADYFVTPASIDEVKAVLALCSRWNIPYYIIGNGSNLLVSDQGYRGLILKLGENFSKVTVGEAGEVIAQSGILLSKLSSEIAKRSFTGFEFAAGIPGTLGGAVTMNAGAYDGEMKQCLVSVRVMNTAGEVLELTKEQLQLGYRTSILQKENYIVLEAVMQFLPGDREKIMSRIRELNTLRREKQPLDQYSAGSTFKRPTGFYASKLIHDADLRGYRVGGAEVSQKHSGFLINKENCTAEDFIGLIKEVVRIVEEKFGVKMEPEVKFLGFEKEAK